MHRRLIRLIPMLLLTFPIGLTLTGCEIEDYDHDHRGYRDHDRDWDRHHDWDRDHRGDRDWDRDHRDWDRR